MASLNDGGVCFTFAVKTDKIRPNHTLWLSGLTTQMVGSIRVVSRELPACLKMGLPK